MSAVPIAPLRKLSIFAVVLATWDAMKLRAANPLAGWQACLEAETQPPIGARLAARQGQPLGSAAAQFGQAGQPGQAASAGLSLHGARTGAGLQPRLLCAQDSARAPCADGRCKAGHWQPPAPAAAVHPPQ